MASSIFPFTIHHFQLLQTMGTKSLATILLTISFIIQANNAAVNASIGVNYGTVANNLPPPTQVAQFLLQSTSVNRVRLFDANPDILKAFSHTGIAITITISNDQIPHLTKLTSAQQWLKSNVQPFVPETNIVRILVGNEVLSTANKLLISTLVPAMQTLQKALVDLSLQTRIKISTPHSLGILSTSSPPSTGKFRQGYDTIVLKPLLTFLQSTDSQFMINAYPFFGCSASTLDFALFRPNPGVFDGSTKFLYTNMLDGQLDAVYSAMKLLGFTDVEIVIAETGWPSKGEPTQIGVDETTAAEYNRNLIRHVNSGDGTPLLPNRTFETYIFGLFNENLKPGPTSERNFGLFRPDMNPVYDIGILRPTARSSIPPEYSTPPETEGKMWCLPKRGADLAALQRNIDFVCGYGVDCGAIEEGGECFAPNTVRSHAAYAMNAYFQFTGRNDFDCDFVGTGAITAVDPSHGQCNY